MPLGYQREYVSGAVVSIQSCRPPWVGFHHPPSPLLSTSTSYTYLTSVKKNHIIVLTLIFPVLDNLRSTFKYNNSLNKATFKVDNLSLFFKNARAQEGTVISSKRLNIKGEIRLAKGRFGPGLLPYSCSPVLTVFIPNAS